MRLLVAEDEPDLNNIICKTLEKNHYTVDSCLDGEEALHCLSMTEYDAAVLAVMMPKKSGIAALRAIRAKGLRTPCLLYTSLPEGWARSRRPSAYTGRSRRSHTRKPCRNSSCLQSPARCV